MDYNVKYRIDINEESASKQLQQFRNSVKQNIPPVITMFSELRRQISKVNSGIAQLRKASLKKSNKVKIGLDESIFKEINDLKKKLQKIKGLVVVDIKEKNSVNANNQAANQAATTNNKKKKKKGWSNRGAKGFGGGFSGLYGLSDIMYAAGFPFPNMLGAAAIGMGTMSVIKDAAEYENTMTTVRSILKATDRDLSSFNQRFADMSINIRKVGVETKFTATEVAGAAKYLAMAGLDIQDINNSIKPIANLAIIGDAPLDRMADIVTNIQTAYGLDSSLMGNISDILTSVTTSTNTNVLEMGEAMKFAAPMMSMAKISFNEAAAAIGALANAGLKGTVAGTALRAMMTRLLNPTKKGAEVLKKYNIQLYELDKNTGKVKLRSLFDIFSQLKAKDASIQDLTRLFDKIGGNAGNNIFTELMKLPELINNSIYARGMAEDIASQKQDTVKGKWDKVTSQFTESGMRVFESAAPVIKTGLDELIKLLQDDGVVEMFRSVASGLMMLCNALISVGKVISDNWWWLGKVFVGGLLAYKFGRIGADIGKLASAIWDVVRPTQALATAVGTAAAAGATGTAAAGGTGLLAAIGGIGGVVGIAVGALASLGVAAYTSAIKTEEAFEKMRKEREDFIGDLKREPFKERVEEINKPLKGKDYFDSLGWDGIGWGNSVISGFFSLADYKKAIAERGSTTGAKLGQSYVLAALQMEDFPYEKFNNEYSKLKADLQGRKNNNTLDLVASHVGQWYSEDKKAQLLHFHNIDADTESKTRDYARAYNFSLETAIKMIDGIQELQKRIKDGIWPLTFDYVADFAKQYLSHDISLEALGAHMVGPTGELIYNDKEAATNKLIQFATEVRRRGIKSWVSQPLFEAIEKKTGISLTTGPIFSTKEARIENDPYGGFGDKIGGGSGSGSGSGSGGALSGVGKTGGNGPRIIKVNINSLIGQLDVKSLGDTDVEMLKDKLTEILVDVIKDFEISYQ